MKSMCVLLAVCDSKHLTISKMLPIMIAITLMLLLKTFEDTQKLLKPTYKEGFDDQSH